MISLVVQKYGGTSVGSPEKIKAVASRIYDLYLQGHQVVVVVSAMGQTTDLLIHLAEEVSLSRPEREMDMLLTTGERISMALLSMALSDLGCPAVSFTGSQAGIVTTEHHTRAKILEVKGLRLQQSLLQGKVVIVAGFQGVSTQGEITTLGRGGSDTTAVALAIRLKASRCEVLTDVEGIYSGDPRFISSARPYSQLSLELALALVIHGAQVMQPRSLALAKAASMPLWVGHSQRKEKGTMLVPSSHRSASNCGEQPCFQALSGQRDVIEWQINDRSDLKKIENEQIPILDLLVTGTGNPSFLWTEASYREVMSQRTGALQCRQGSVIFLAGEHLHQSLWGWNELLEFFETKNIEVYSARQKIFGYSFFVKNLSNSQFEQTLRELHDAWI